MLKINFLRNLFLLSLALACGLPLYDFLSTYPSYNRLLVEQTESEAIRFVRFLVDTKQLKTLALGPGQLSPWVTREISRMTEDALLVKLRIFSSTGRIVYSTKSDEIGKVNTRDYFVNQVAKGENYSKVVHHDHMSAEGERQKQDVVETYVPIMVDGRFHGAVEIYYDITREQARLSAINLHSSGFLVCFALAFLILMLLALRRAQAHFVALTQAELNLQSANENLENRVLERTEQLQHSNVQLEEEIQERVRTEAALKEALESASDARDKIDTILESVADGLIVTDSRGCVVLMNRVAETIFALGNWSPGDSLGEIINNPELLEKIALAEERLGAGLSGEFDLLYSRTPDSEQQIYSARTSRLRVGDGEPRGLVILLQDVTKIRGIERMKSEFVSMAAHELRTPLTMILGYAELLQQRRTFSEAEQLEFLGIINEKAVALSAIVDDLLDVTRIEEGRPLELVRETMDLRTLVESSVAEAQLRKDPGHSFVVRLPPDPVYAEVDRERLQQVLQNLLSNAIKYSPDGGEIGLRLIRVEGAVELSVSDQGMGMTAAQAQLAFDRFYRADTSDAGIRGTGLGLSIVKYIVEAHGGQVRIASQLSQGTTVTCRFPA